MNTELTGIWNEAVVPGQGTNSAFAWIERRKPRKTPVSADGFSAVIRIEIIRNESLRLYLSTNLFAFT
jgi:hypothetical protein